MRNLSNIYLGTSGSCARSSKNYGEQSSTGRYKGMEPPVPVASTSSQVCLYVLLFVFQFVFIYEDHPGKEMVVSLYIDV
jgi:hypothetical protein